MSYGTGRQFAVKISLTNIVFNTKDDYLCIATGNPTPKQPTYSMVARHGNKEFYLKVEKTTQHNVTLPSGLNGNVLNQLAL